MPQNIIKILDKNFSDLKAGEKMYISSPEIITKYIEKIPLFLITMTLIIKQ